MEIFKGIMRWLVFISLFVAIVIALDNVKHPTWLHLLVGVGIGLGSYFGWIKIEN